MPAQSANRPEDKEMSDIDLSSPEVKAAIKAAVDEATDGLIKKRDELLGEVKQLRKGQEIKPEQLEAIEAERDQIQDALKQAQKDLKKAQDAAKAATEGLETEQNFTKSLLVDNGLTAALTEAGVTNPALLKAAVALHKGSVTIEADGDKRVAKVGDKTLADHLKEWAGSDEGKHFVAAQNNSGGGASGGQGGGAAEVKGKIDGTPAERTAYFAQKIESSNSG